MPPAPTRWVDLRPRCCLSRTTSKPFRKSTADGWKERCRKQLIDASFWIWTVQPVRSMASKKPLPTTGISDALATIPCFASTSSEIAKVPLLRPGNVHSADRWKELLEPIVARYEKKKQSAKYFRGDAAFAKPEIYEYLEEKGFLYAIRLPANQVLQEKIEHLLTRPVGRPPRKPVVWLADFKYQAASWDRASSGDCQGRVASRRTLSESRFHRDQQERTSPRGGSLLQRSRHGRAVDQGRQVCLELDAVVLPALCPESGEVGSVCFGLQPGQFSATSGPSQKNQTLVPSHPIEQT